MKELTQTELMNVAGCGDATQCKNDVIAGGSFGAAVGGSIGSGFGPVGGAIGAGAGALVGGAFAGANSPACKK